LIHGHIKPAIAVGAELAARSRSEDFGIAVLANCRDQYAFRRIRGRRLGIDMPREPFWSARSPTIQVNSARGIYANSLTTFQVYAGIDPVVAERHAQILFNAWNSIALIGGIGSFVPAINYDSVYFFWAEISQFVPCARTRIRDLDDELVILKPNDVAFDLSSVFQVNGVCPAKRADQKN